MKNIFLKIFSWFYTPEPTLTEQQLAVLTDQYLEYIKQVCEYEVKMALPEYQKDFEMYSIRRSMAKHRMSALRIKILKRCPCGSDHTEDILSEKRIGKIYREQLFKHLNEEN